MDGCGRGGARATGRCFEELVGREEKELQKVSKISGLCGGLQFVQCVQEMPDEVGEVVGVDVLHGILQWEHVVHEHMQCTHSHTMYMYSLCTIHVHVHVHVHVYVHVHVHVHIHVHVHVHVLYIYMYMKRLRNIF